jgi:hypothetical protein
MTVLTDELAQTTGDILPRIDDELAEKVWLLVRRQRKHKDGEFLKAWVLFLYEVSDPGIVAVLAERTSFEPFSLAKAYTPGTGYEVCKPLKD